MSHFTSTRATPNHCPRCQAPTLTALDEGIPATVNPTPLPDRQAEITALLQGLHTYTLTSNAQLIHRDTTRITANTLHGTIHAQHKCAGPAQLLIDDLLGGISA
jgi:hypothetical protein